MTMPDVSVRRIARTLLTVAFVAIVLAFVVHSVPAVVGAEASFVVLSGSMEPAISAGDVVVVYEVDPATIEAGAVITFGRGSNPIPVTHRVVGVEGDGEALAFRTAGDNNEGPDPAPVPADSVVGVVPAVDLPVIGPVLAVIPYMGYVVEFAGTPVGFGVLVAGPFAVLLVLEAWTFVRERRRDAADGDDSDDAIPALEGETLPLDGTAQSTGTGGETTAAEARTSEFDGEASANAAIAVATPDIGYTTVVLAGFTGYATVVAVLLEEVWAVSVAVAVAGLTLMAVGIGRGWFAAETPDENGSIEPESTGNTDSEEVGSGTDRDSVGDSGSSHGSGGDRSSTPVRTEMLPAAFATSSAVGVESLSELERIAAREGTDVIDVVPRREYVVFSEDLRFTCPYLETERRDETGEAGETEVAAMSDGGETEVH